MLGHITMGSNDLPKARAIDRRSVPLLVGAAVGIVAIALGLAVGDSPAEQANLAARWTARAALPMFLVAYLASSMLRLWPTDLTRAVMRRRRQWGLGFALAHTIHLAALANNVLVFGPSREPETLIGGGLAYAFIYVMALTSNNWSMKLLGKNWKWLHRIGIHYIWLIFAVSYAGRIANPDMWLTGVIFTPITLGALAIRLYARFGRPTLAHNKAPA